MFEFGKNEYKKFMLSAHVANTAGDDAVGWSHDHDDRFGKFLNNKH